MHGAIGKPRSLPQQRQHAAASQMQTRLAHSARRNGSITRVACTAVQRRLSIHPAPQLGSAPASCCRLARRAARGVRLGDRATAAQNDSCAMSQREARRHGRRLRALDDAFHRTVKYALRPLDYEQFAEQFEGLGDALVADLFTAYKQVLHHTRVNIEADFGELCEEHELPDRLATLEAMCEEQGIADGDAADATRQPALGPTRAIRLGLLRAKQAEVEGLRGVLAQCEARTAELAASLAGRRRAAQELAAKAQPLVEQLEAVHVSSKAWANRVVDPVT